VTPRRAAPLLAALVVLLGLLGASGCARRAKLGGISWGGIDVDVRFLGTGRAHGRVADLRLRNLRGAERPFEVPAGTVLRAPRGSGLQAYGVVSPARTTLGPFETRWVALRGVCLDAERAPWPAGRWVDPVSVDDARGWASLDGEGNVTPLDARRWVAFLAVTDGPFAAARRDPAYVPPSVPLSESVVRQWAVWGTVGGKTKADLAATVAREAPGLPEPERDRAVEEVWAAAAVVVRKGGAAAAEEARVDWAALDLTLK
jgi:hypothetical protein